MSAKDKKIVGKSPVFIEQTGGALVPSCFAILTLSLCHCLYRLFNQNGRDWTVVKKRQEIGNTVHITRFAVLKQFQKRSNDIRSERLARRQFGNQRTMTVVGARETARRRRAKGGLKDYGIGSTLQYMAKDSGCSPEESSSTGQPWHVAMSFRFIKLYVNNNQGDQIAVSECDEACCACNLIANLTLDTEENKMYKAIKKSKRHINSRFVWSAKTNLDGVSGLWGRLLQRDSCLIALLTKTETK
ncbi:hypothetical protein Tco_0226735 [Tanacetum coccineum]